MYMYVCVDGFDFVDGVGTINGGVAGVAGAVRIGGIIIIERIMWRWRLYILINVERVPNHYLYLS